MFFHKISHIQIIFWTWKIRHGFIQFYQHFLFCRARLFSIIIFCIRFRSLYFFLIKYGDRNKKNSPSPSLVKVKWSVPNMTKMQNYSIFNMMVTMINGNDVSSLYDTCSDMCKYIHMYQGISFTNDGTCVLWNCYSIKHISCQRCLCTIKHIPEWTNKEITMIII